MCSSTRRHNEKIIMALVRTGRLKASPQPCNSNAVSPVVVSQWRQSRCRESKSEKRGKLLKIFGLKKCLKGNVDTNEDQSVKVNLCFHVLLHFLTRLSLCYRSAMLSTASRQFPAVLAVNFQGTCRNTNLMNPEYGRKAHSRVHIWARSMNEPLGKA